MAASSPYRGHTMEFDAKFIRLMVSCIIDTILEPWGPTFVPAACRYCLLGPWTHALQSSAGRSPDKLYYFGLVQTLVSPVHRLRTNQMDHSRRSYKHHRLKHIMVSIQPAWLEDLPPTLEGLENLGVANRLRVVQGWMAHGHVGSFNAIACF